MSEKPQNKSPKAKNPTLFSTLVFVTINLILLSGLAWLVLCVGLFSAAIFKNSAAVLQQAQRIALLNTHFLAQSSAPFAHRLFSLLTGCQQHYFDFIARFSFANNAVTQVFLPLLWTATVIVFSRALIFILALPLFLVILSVFLTDGLVKRDIRKFQGARESTLIFHRSKHGLRFLLFAPFLGYLCMPFAINPALFLFGQSLLLGWGVFLAATYFKKYI